MLMFFKRDRETFGCRKTLEGAKIAEATMAEAEDKDTSSPERENQTKINKKKLRKRKRPNKSENKQEEENDAKIDSTLTQTEDTEEEEKEETKVNNNDSCGIMSSEFFSSLTLSEATSNAIADMGFDRMTQVTPFLHSVFFFFFKLVDQIFS